MKPNRFRFRAWDKKNNCFLLNKNKYGEYLSNYFISFYGFIWEKEKIGNESLDMSEIVLMQSTGLLDRNGKEVFEGDIIKNISANFSEAVVFDNGKFIKSKYGEDLSEDLDWHKIIGNKFNNPELLK